VTRLLDMGIEEYLLASTLSLVVGQRLVRRLCEHCRQPEAFPITLVESARELGIDPATVQLHKAAGCAACQHSGYRGRVVIAELLPVDEALQALILSRAPAGAIEKRAIASGMRTMQADGLLKAFAGLTSMEEVFRVTQNR